MERGILSLCRSVWLATYRVVTIEIVPQVVFTLLQDTSCRLITNL